MKILQINSVYKQGSTGKIVASLADSLRSQGHSVLVLYGIANACNEIGALKVCTNLEHKFNALLSRITGIPFGGFFISNYKIKKIISEFQPDIVHLHCINASIVNVYSLLDFLSKSGIPTILTLHAEIFHTAGCEHAIDCDKWKLGCNNCNVYRQRVSSWFFDRSSTSFRKINNAINSFPVDKLSITAVSPWLQNRANQSVIMNKYGVYYVPNGVDTSVFHYRANSRIINRPGYDKIILFVTPNFTIKDTDIKGGYLLTQIAVQLPSYNFIVVATNISKLLPQMPPNVTLWGRAKSSEELAQLYSEADLTLLLSKRETFSMVTAESLCCGTPVVGFKAGGPESIAVENCTIFVDFGNIAQIVDVLKNCKFPLSKRDISKISAEQYSKDYMTNSYLNIYAHHLR